MPSVGIFFHVRVKGKGGKVATKCCVESGKEPCLYGVNGDLEVGDEIGVAVGGPVDVEDGVSGVGAVFVFEEEGEQGGCVWDLDGGAGGSLEGREVVDGDAGDMCLCVVGDGETGGIDGFFELIF